MKLLEKKMCLVLLLLLIGLIGFSSGCTTVVLHPISGEDIFFIPKGSKVGDRVVKKDGYYLSEFYLKEIAKARVDSGH